MVVTRGFCWAALLWSRLGARRGGRQGLQLENKDHPSPSDAHIPALVISGHSESRRGPSARPSPARPSFSTSWEPLPLPKWSTSPGNKWKARRPEVSSPFGLSVTSLIEMWLQKAAFPPACELLEDRPPSRQARLPVAPTWGCWPAGRSTAPAEVMRLPRDEGPAVLEPLPLPICLLGSS